MRNLIIFLWKYNFFILFLILEFICASLVVQNNNFQRASFINSSNKLVGSVQSVVNSITEYLNLRNANDALIRENAHLRSLMPNAFYSDSTGGQTVKDTIRRQQYIFKTAKVVNNSINRRNNYLTLNKGSEQGIQPKMGVLSSDGVVGIVKDLCPFVHKSKQRHNHRDNEAEDHQTQEADHAEANFVFEVDVLAVH